MDDLISVIIMLLSGYAIRYALIFSGQMGKICLNCFIFYLPIITFVITKTTLVTYSLGMIGALSIVRFRHPVKSALELIIYFDLITIGIAASVKNNYAIILSLLTVVVLVSLKLFNNYLRNNKKSSFYNISFNEGVELNQIEIIASKKIEEIENHNNLKSVYNDNENNDYIYRLTFEDKNQLQDFKNKIENSDGLKKIDVNFI